MIIKNPKDYRLLEFKKTPSTHKSKYFAILEHKQTGRQKKVPFGSKSYEQYCDKIGEYSSKDHGDKERRRRYRARHFGEDKNKFSSGYFAWKYLW